MILAIDIGNTGTAFGFYKDDSMCHHCKVSSKPYKTADEFSMLLNTVCMQEKIDKSDVEGCVISSVVPPLTEQILQSVEKVFLCKPLIITHGVKTGLNIKIDIQTQLGSDIVANNVAAASVLPKPFAVIDLGTATTISAVNNSGELFWCDYCSRHTYCGRCAFRIRGRICRIFLWKRQSHYWAKIQKILCSAAAFMVPRLCWMVLSKD